MKTLVLRLLLAIAVLANLSVGAGSQAFAHAPAHQVEAAAEHDCCDPAADHLHEHATLPGGLAADCHCDLGTCAPGLGIQVEVSQPGTRLTLLKLRVPDDAPPASGNIPPLRPPRA